MQIHDYGLVQLRDAPGQTKLKGFRPVVPVALPPSDIYGAGAEAPARPAADQQQQQQQHPQPLLQPQPLPQPQQQPLPPQEPQEPQPQATGGYDPAELREAQQLASRLRSECDLLK